MKAIAHGLLLALLALLMASCASAPIATRSADGGLPAPNSATGKQAFSNGADYHIGAQDLLDVSVLGVPDLSREVRVDANGKISLPLIGVVQAGGDTINELQQDIQAKLGAKYLQNPQVTVFVKEYTSQRVTVNGSVKNPGIYPITGKTTLMQVLAQAGGLDPLAEHNGVVLFRTVDGKRMMARFDTDKIINGSMPDPEVYGNDLIDVAQSGAKNGFQNAIKLAPLIGLFILL